MYVRTIYYESFYIYIGTYFTSQVIMGTITFNKSVTVH